MTTDRIKEIQAETAYPNNTSVQQALLKVWDECEQGKKQVKNCSMPDIGGSFLYELKTIAYSKGSTSERLEEIKEKLSSK